MLEFKYYEQPIRTLASGNQLNIPIYHFKGDDGKKVHVQGNIHGPEVQGVAAAYELVKHLQKEKVIHGQINIVPSINPVALDLKFNGLQVGYADPNEYTVGNFNRIYQMLVKNKPKDEAPVDLEDPQKLVLEDFVAAHLKSTPDEIAKDFKAGLLAVLGDIKTKKGRMGLRFGLHLGLTIQEMAQDADYLVDLHTDAKAVYYGYSFDANVTSYHIFDIPYMIEVDPDDFDGVLDESFLIPWIKLQRAFKEAGRDLDWKDIDKEAITLELGNADEIDAAAAVEDAGRIMNYLRYKGVLEGKVIPPKKPLYRCKFKHRDNYYAPVGGLVFWHKKPGDSIKTGDLVATILELGSKGKKHLPREHVVKATKPGVLINISRSQVTHQGIQIFSILTELKKVS